MNRLTVLYLSGVLFAIFVPFTVSFPNSEKEVEPIPDGTTAASPVSVSKEPDHHLICGPLKCPANATSCVYTEATTPDLKFIERNSTCSANNGEVVYFNSDKVPNDSNDTKFSTIANSVSGDFDNFNKFFEELWQSFANSFSFGFFN